MQVYLPRALYLCCFRPIKVRSCLELFCFNSLFLLFCVICTPVLTELHICPFENEIKELSFPVVRNFELALRRRKHKLFFLQLNRNSEAICTLKIKGCVPQNFDFSIN